MQEWQRLSWAAINQAMGYYLHGCANIALARSPRQAWLALRKTQTGLLGHSARTIVDAMKLWRKQNRELLVMRAEHERRAPHPATKLRTTRD